MLFKKKKSIQIKKGILIIHEEDDSVTEFTIPNRVKSIGESAFLGYKNLENIYVSNKNKNFCSCDGILYNRDMTMIIKYPNAKGTDFVIPDSVTTIGNMAFSWCDSLKSITIPNSVTSIGYDAFNNCSSLTSITIQNSVTSIGNSAFSCCTSLESISIPKNVTSIGGGAFLNCQSLTSITIPDSVTSIGGHTFSLCLSLKSITIYKDDIYISLTLEDTYDFIQEPTMLSSGEETCLYKFIFSDINIRQQFFDILKPCYKIPLALFMTFAYPQESSFYLSYLKYNIEDAVRYLTDTESIDLLYRFLELGFVTKKNIDGFISYAVEHTQNGGSAEPQLVLSKYKSDNFGSNGADAMNELML